MEELFAELGAFIEDNSLWAGPILGLTTFGESMVVIGAFFPATALMLVAGGLVGSGVLHPVPVLGFCIAGAVLGDAISYWIGRRAGARAWRWKMFRPHRRKLARARLFFRTYGVTSIYICRFLGPVRAFVPLIAGMTGMPHRRFQMANIGSAMIWVPVMLAPGYLAAKGVGLMGALDPHLAGLIVAVLLAATVAGVWGWRYLNAAKPPL